MKGAKFSVPATPPSVNHYMVHTRRGLHFRTPEARAFEEHVAVRAGGLRGKKVEATEVDIILWLGPKQKLDVDNAPKSLLDSLVRAEVIRSDASITRLLVEKHRAESPQTDIYIRWE
jgi:Holliday junction resolvase RusA-like endonuclease